MAGDRRTAVAGCAGVGQSHSIVEFLADRVDSRAGFVGVTIAALLLVMAVALMRQRTAPPQSAPVSLVDFRPVDDPHVRVIGGPL